MLAELRKVKCSQPQNKSAFQDTPTKWVKVVVVSSADAVVVVLFVLQYLISVDEPSWKSMSSKNCHIPYLTFIWPYLTALIYKKKKCKQVSLPCCTIHNSWRKLYKKNGGASTCCLNFCVFCIQFFLSQVLCLCSRCSNLPIQAKFRKATLMWDWVGVF